MPYHLDELSLIDCKISPVLAEHLMDALLTKSHLRKVALVKIMHSERSFDKVIEFVKNSGHLKELDLSWSSVRPSIIIKLLEVLREDRNLQCLSLGYNRLLQE